MIMGVGTDICSVARISQSFERFGDDFVARILTPDEIVAAGVKVKDVAFLAKRFAAKEAVAKALGCGIGARLSFQDIEIYREDGRRPSVHLVGDAADHFSGIHLHLSLSDEKENAIAFVVAEE